MARGDEHQKGLAAPHGGPVLRAMSTAELADAYGVSRRTVRRWLAPFAGLIGKRVGHTYTPAQVGVIMGLIGPF